MATSEMKQCIIIVLSGMILTDIPTVLLLVRILDDENEVHEKKSLQL